MTEPPDGASGAPPPPDSVLRFLVFSLLSAVLAGAPLAQTATRTGSGDSTLGSDGADRSDDSAPEASIDAPALLSASGARGSGLANSPWPMQGGNLQHTNRTPVEGPASVVLEWAYDAGVASALVNQPVLGEDGTIYTSSIADFLFAVNPDGTERWRAATGGVRNSVAVASDGTIYSGSGDGGLYAINPDGSQKWRTELGGRINTSPAIAPDGTVYIASNAQKLFAVNPDGTLKWERNLGGFALSSPAVAEDGTVVTGSSNGNVVAFSASGAFLWNVTYSGIARSPTIAGGVVYLGMDERFVALALDTGAEVWERVGATQFETPGYFAGATPLVFGRVGSRLVALSAASGETVWERDLGGNREPSAVTLDAFGKAYVLSRFPSQTGDLLILDAASGDLLSTTPIDARLERAPILDGQGRVIVPTYDGLLAFTSAGGPVLSVSPGAIAFGEVASGESASRTLTLGNTGGSPLTVFAVRIDAGQEAFSVVFDDAILIAPGASVNVPVTFSPPEARAFTGQLVVESDSQESSFVFVDLTGTGTQSTEPPIARNDAATTPEDQAVTVQVLNNDESRVSEPLAVVATSTPSNGTAQIVNSGTRVRYTPEADFFGTDSFTYTIEDSGGRSTATVTVTVSPVNDAPLAQDDEAATDEDTPVTVQVLANDSDVDSSMLTVASVTEPASGAAEIVASGTAVRYTPEANFFGTDSFTYTVSDGDGGTATATVAVTVAPVNDAPIAQNDAATTPEDTAVEIAVLNNDSDPDGDALTVTALGTPASGAVTTDGTTVTYTPEADFFGSDPFTYTVSDSNGGTVTATVSVTVTPVNDAPLAQDDAASTSPNEAVVIAVLANDSDVDGDALTVTEASGARNGALTTDGATVTYTPEAGFRGTDSFTYTITDGTVTASASVTVTVGGNAPPLAQNDGATTPEDQAVSVAVLANDSDPDGDALTVASVTAPDNGAATTDGVTVTYTPDADFNGTDSFTYTVADGAGGTATATVSVTVTPVNDAPLAQDDSAVTPEATPVEIAVLANDSDPDGDALTVASITPPASGGTATTDGATVTFTPEAGFSGTVTFTYTVTDGDLTDTAEVTVTVSGQNLPPIARDDAAPVRPGDSVLIDVLANDSDPEGQALTITAVQSPTASGGTAAPEDGQIRYTAPSGFSGTDTFTYTVADPQGATATATVTLTAQAYRFALTDLGTLGGVRSAAMAVTADGRVVGTAEDASGALRPTLWRTSSGTAEALTLPGSPAGFAAAIDGQTVVGVQYGASGEAEAFRLDTGAATLPGLGGTLTSAYGVREGGVTVGSSAEASGAMQAMAWDAAGTGTPLGTFGLARSEAFGVSPLGLVIGYAQTDTEERAFAGPDLLPGVNGRAYAANASGVIVGSTMDATGDVSAVRWTGAAAPEALSGLGGGFAEAYAVNGAGWVVGASGVAAVVKNGATPPRGPLPLGGSLAPEAASPSQGTHPAGSAWSAETSGVERAARGVGPRKSEGSGTIETRAVLWVDGQTLDLGTIIDVPGWTLLEARGINDAGQIAGTGLFDGQPRAFLLTPTDNTAPLAADDRAETAMGRPVEIMLVANDRDADGDDLAVAALLAPQHGSVQPAGPLAARYTPASGFTGEDVFGYTLADGRGGLAQAEVRVTVRAETPEALALRTPAPNPVSGAVLFAFILDAAADDVRLDVTDLLGRSLAVAAEGARDAGEHTVRFDVGSLAPGTYVCRLLVGEQALMRTFTVVR